MAKPKIILSENYQNRLVEIENFIWVSSGRNIASIESFLSAHETVLKFLVKNPDTPQIHIETGDRSWPFSEGRYRLFFTYSGANLLLLDIIDNRMSNLSIYPKNSLPTYDEE